MEAGQGWRRARTCEQKGLNRRHSHQSGSGHCSLGLLGVKCRYLPTALQVRDAVHELCSRSLNPARDKADKKKNADTTPKLVLEVNTLVNARMQTFKYYRKPIIMYYENDHIGRL